MVKLKIMVRDGYLKLRISENKTRYYKSLHSFLSGNPKLTYWNEKRSKFTSQAADYEENNTRLAELFLICSNIVEQHPGLSVKEVADRFEKAIRIVQPEEEELEDAQTTRIADFINVIIEREKCKKGCNFEIYDKLLKKCRKMFMDFDTWTFAQLNYKRCNQIANTMLKYPGYRTTSKAFRNMLGKAHKDIDVPFDLTQINGFSFASLLPDRDTEDIELPDVLTTEQVRIFTSYICTSEREQMCYDFCIFMLHSFMAPCDVISLKTNNITRNGTLLFRRKKTHVRTEVPITPVMQRIIDKYKGTGYGNYIFPIMDDEKALKYKTRDYFYKKFREELSDWLKLPGRKMHLDFRLYPYVFRHTAITLALDGGLPLTYIASTAGTSVEMIQKHYYNGNNPQNHMKLQAVFMGAVDYSEGEASACCF